MSPISNNSYAVGLRRQTQPFYESPLGLNRLKYRSPSFSLWQQHVDLIENMRSCQLKWFLNFFKYTIDNHQTKILWVLYIYHSPYFWDRGCIY